MQTLFTAYHVAGSKWREGEDLKTWTQLVEEGVLTEADWQWEDTPIGSGDTDVVCFYSTLEEAMDHRDEFGGTIVKIEIDLADYASDDEGLADALEDLSYWREGVSSSCNLPEGLRLGRVHEGYGCFDFAVPSFLCSVVE